MTQHFLIAHEDHAGENFDLVVEAADINEAKTLWRDYYEIGEDKEPEKLFAIPALGGTARALPWHEPTGLALLEENNE